MFKSTFNLLFAPAAVNQQYYLITLIWPFITI